MSTPRLKVIIVGGGFSGTALAVQLLRRVPGLPMAVIDKGSRLVMVSLIPVNTDFIF
jgi:cation diffusion facilitator CzcD-associated flavoprotein CzcO